MEGAEREFDDYKDEGERDIASFFYNSNETAVYSALKIRNERQQLVEPSLKMTNMTKNQFFCCVASMAFNLFGTLMLKQQHRIGGKGVAANIPGWLVKCLVWYAYGFMVVFGMRAIGVGARNWARQRRNEIRKQWAAEKEEGEEQM